MDNKVQKIRFDFLPYQFENKLHAVEKEAVAGVKHRYLCGVASGTKVDGQQERLTERAIKSMQEQANSGDILLFAGKHDVNFFEDIGILTKSDVLQNGDWYCEFRLYDSSDDVGQTTLERSDKVWKQSLGIAPYGRARKRGFSIEGVIPDGGIVHMSANDKRVIDDVKIEGVVLVNSPAYLPSIAHSVYKALGEPDPVIERRKISTSLVQGIERDSSIQSYYRSKYQINENLEEQIEAVMTSSDDDKDKKEKLNDLFNEYKDLMIQLVLQSSAVYEDNMPIEQEVKVTKNIFISKATVYKNILSELTAMEKVLKEGM